MKRVLIWDWSTRVQVPLVGPDLQLGESKRGELENEHGEHRRAAEPHHQERDED
jgi:hypothetical protein